MSKVTVAITGTGSLIGQAILKSIRRSELKEKVHLVGMDYFSNTVGSFWCAENFLLPDILNPEVSEQEWLDKIKVIISNTQAKILFVGVDFELSLFAKHKADLEAQTGCIIQVSRSEVIEIADDKYLTYQFLKENDLWHPESHLTDSLDVSGLTYPLIVKPRKGARSVGVYKVGNEQQLVSALEKSKDPVIQECVGDDTTEYTCGVLYLNGELKASIVLNRSLKEGNTFISHFRKDFPDIITTYIKDIADKLKPDGACNFQLRIDKNGIPKLFEINARHSGTTYIRSLFGYNEVEYIINSLLFKQETTFILKEGTVVRYYDEFFIER